MEVETSIIIRTLNEARHLEKLVRSIREQTYTKWEIVLVDSGSTDSTLEIARRYTRNIHHIKPEDFTFGRSLNLGCQHAVGKYLVFVSAHACPLTNSWLSNLIQPFDESSIGMVYGRQRGVESSRISEERDLERQFGSTSKILIDEAFGNNGNAAIRRDLWAGQPFDESLTGLEDVDWARKIQLAGYRVYYAANAAVYHIHEESLKQVYRRYFREGLAYRRIFPGYKFNIADLIKSVVYNVPADFLYAVRMRKTLKKVLQIPATRVTQCLGIWRGLNYHKSLQKRMALQLYYPKTSESVVIESAGQHQLRETEVPTAGIGEILIQVAYAGVCATDLEVAHGNLEYYREGQARYPIIPGHEYSGVVVEVGESVTGIRKGDKVVGECAIGCGACPGCAGGEFYRCTSRKEVGVINMNGAYGRYLKMPFRYAHRLPPEVSLREAALIEPLAVCLKGLRKLGAQDSGAVGIIGAGPLGNFCAQIMKRRGHTVTVIDRDQGRLRLVDKYDINAQSEIGALSGFPYLIDATGDETVIPLLIERSGPSAKILLIGLPYLHPVQVCFSTVPCYDKNVYGSIASEPRDWEEAIQLVRSGSINLEDHTAAVVPLESYETAWKAVLNRERFKVLLLCNPSLAGY